MHSSKRTMLSTAGLLAAIALAGTAAAPNAAAPRPHQSRRCLTTPRAAPIRRVLGRLPSCTGGGARYPDRLWAADTTCPAVRWVKT